jgi:hypothetical protein
VRSGDMVSGGQLRRIVQMWGRDLHTDRVERGVRTTGAEAQDIVI